MPRISKGYVPTRWGQLHYRHSGEQGKPLVFIHQSGNSSQMWTPVLARFGERHRAIAIDLPGFGMSDPPPEEPVLPDYAEVILEGLDALGIAQAAFIGFHTGAALSVVLAAKWPGRVNSLVLIGVPRFDPNDPTTPEERLRRIQPDEAGAYLGRIWSGLELPTVAAHHREMADRLNGGARNYLWSSGAVRGFDLWSLLPTVQCPVLLLAATEDAMYAHQAEAARLLPHARLQELEGNPMLADSRPDDLVRLVSEFAG